MNKPTSVMGRRIAAYFIDGLIVGIVDLAIFFAMAEKKSDVVRGLGLGEQTNVYGNIKLGSDEWVLTGGKFALYLAIIAVFWWLYYAVLQGTKGWTPGKLAVGIRTVAEETGQAPGIGKATVRWLLWIVDSFPWFLPLVGLITALVTEKNQRVGDMVAKTVVVRKDAVGQPIQFAQPGFAGGYGQAPPAYGQAPPAYGQAPPAQPAQGQPQAADWYPDPRGEARLRYWDGQQWTDHTSA